MLSWVSQTEKVNTVWSHVHVESKEGKLILIKNIRCVVARGMGGIEIECSWSKVTNLELEVLVANLTRI